MRFSHGERDANAFMRLLVDPVLGEMLQQYLLADEQVSAFNLCWELREHFIEDIQRIRHGLATWSRLQEDIEYEEWLVGSVPQPSWALGFNPCYSPPHDYGRWSTSDYRSPSEDS